MRCFGEKAELDLSDGKDNWRQWTVIVGDNGLGKTTLLQVLAVISSNTHPSLNIHNYIDNPFSFLAKKNFEDVRLTIFLKRKNSKVDETIVFLHQVGEIKLLHFGSGGFTSFGYGANRFMSFTSLIDSKSDNSATLFNDDAKLINAEEWLLQLDYSASKESPVQEYAQKKRDQVKEILIELLPDISAIRFTEPTRKI